MTGLKDTLCVVSAFGNPDSLSQMLRLRDSLIVKILLFKHFCWFKASSIDTQTLREILVTRLQLLFTVSLIYLLHYLSQYDQHYMCRFKSEQLRKGLMKRINEKFLSDVWYTFSFIRTKFIRTSKLELPHKIKIICMLTWFSLKNTLYFKNVLNI